MGRIAALIAGLTRDLRDLIILPNLPSFNTLPFIIRLFYCLDIISINTNVFSQIFPFRIKAID